jgi:23S rRNA-/tRNA-specific pseudouridylate synthase
MDGDFNVTIQKLLLQWIPDSTLDCIKWVHQLDYATSGVLCVARNKDAAAIASSSFANRCTNKQYIAILQGRLILDNWPLMTHRLQINEQEDSLDITIDTKKKRKIPADENNIKVQWQRDIMNQNLISNYNAFQTILKNKGTTLNGFTNEKVDEQR